MFLRRTQQKTTKVCVFTERNKLKTKDVEVTFRAASGVSNSLYNSCKIPERSKLENDDHRIVAKRTNFDARNLTSEASSLPSFRTLNKANPAGVSKRANMVGRI